MDIETLEHHCPLIHPKRLNDYLNIPSSTRLENFRPMPTRMEDLPWTSDYMREKYTLGPAQLHYTKVNHLNSNP